MNDREQYEAGMLGYAIGFLIEHGWSPDKIAERARQLAHQVQAAMRDPVARRAMESARDLALSAPAITSPKEGDR